jgi:hypothetical protein
MRGKKSGGLWKMEACSERKQKTGKKHEAGKEGGILPPSFQ